MIYLLGFANIYDDNISSSYILVLFISAAPINVGAYTACAEGGVANKLKGT